MTTRKAMEASMGRSAARRTNHVVETSGSGRVAGSTDGSTSAGMRSLSNPRKIAGPMTSANIPAMIMRNGPSRRPSRRCAAKPINRHSATVEKNQIGAVRNSMSTSSISSCRNRVPGLRGWSPHCAGDHPSGSAFANGESHHARHRPHTHRCPHSGDAGMTVEVQEHDDCRGGEEHHDRDHRSPGKITDVPRAAQDAVDHKNTSDERLYDCPNTQC